MHASESLDAARTLWSHRQSGTVIDHLPVGCRPTSRAEGYAVQALWPVVSGRAVRGWKIAATSDAGQRHINVSGPLAGRLLEGYVFEDGATIPSAGNRMRVAEPEMAFRFARDLPPRDAPRSTEEVMAAVASLHPSIEIPDSRYEVFTAVGEAQLIADNACASYFVLGSAAPEGWRALDLATHPAQGHVRRADGRTWSRDGSGAAVLGDPRVALTWLVNELSSLGLGLHAGEFVTTGTCMPPLEIEPGDAVGADFGPLGRVAMRFAEDAA